MEDVEAGALHRAVAGAGGLGEGGGQELADDLEVPLLGQVPLVPDLREGSDIGEPIVVADPENEASQVFRAMAERIDVELAPKRIYRTELKIV